MTEKNEFHLLNAVISGIMVGKTSEKRGSVMTRIYLIRHAEAEGNLFRVAHGQYNSTITPQGYRQLAALRRRFDGVTLDAVYGSDLLRAHTTASALYVPRGLPFRPMPALREIRIGGWEQQTWGALQRLDMENYVNFNKHPQLWHAQGAETFDQVRDRMLAAVRQIAAEHPGGTVAAASHGSALRTLLGTLQGMSLEEIGATGHGDNTAVSLLEAEGDQIRVIYRDDNSHVPPELSTFRRQAWHRDDAATEPGLWFRGVREDPAGRALEAMLDETPVGRVAFHQEGETLRVTDYEIVPAFRGQRFGVQLLGQAVQFARTLGLETLAVDCGADLADYFLKYGFGRAVPRGDALRVELDFRRVIREIP